MEKDVSIGTNIIRKRSQMRKQADDSLCSGDWTVSRSRGGGLAKQHGLKVDTFHLQIYSHKHL